MRKDAVIARWFGGWSSDQTGDKVLAGVDRSCRCGCW